MKNADFLKDKKQWLGIIDDPSLRGEGETWKD